MKEEEGLEPYFSLRSFYVKPMDFPDDAGVRVRVRGYLHDKSEGTLDWHVDFPAGYHLPFLVKMEEYSRGRWEGLRWVEVSAGFGEEELDWEVCLDDLVVGFEEVEEAGGKGKAMEQVVLGEG